MDNWNDDIERYIAGKMSVREMFELEKKALSDPFLNDALEGAKKIPVPQFHQDVEQLRQEITKPSAGRPWLWPLRIAALVIVGVGGFWIYTQFNDQIQTPTLSLKKDSPSPAVLDSTTQGEMAMEQPKESTQILKEADNQPNNSSIIKREKPKKMAEELIADNSSVAEAEAKTEIKEEPIVPAVDELINVSEKTAVADQSSELKKQGGEALSLRSANVLSAQHPAKIISGQVTSEEEGLPLPGVNVLIKGTTLGTTTDVNGRYQIAMDSIHEELVFSFIGFQNQTIKANQSTLDVQLNTDLTQLSEVVVTGFAPGNADDTHEPVVKLAEPAGGRRAYDKYLQNSLVYPVQALENKVKGKVTVQFTVRTDGTLDEFNVLKGLGYGCDEEVIRLVKEGPKWSPTTEDNVPVESEVRVKVKFSPPADK